MAPSSGKAGVDTHHHLFTSHQQHHHQPNMTPAPAPAPIPTPSRPILLNPSSRNAGADFGNNHPASGAIGVSRTYGAQRTNSSTSLSKKEMPLHPTLLDLYNFHLAASPRSPLSTSLASSPAFHQLAGKRSGATGTGLGGSSSVGGSLLGNQGVSSQSALNSGITGTSSALSMALAAAGGVNSNNGLGSGPSQGFGQGGSRSALFGNSQPMGSLRTSSMGSSINAYLNDAAFQSSPEPTSGLGSSIASALEASTSTSSAIPSRGFTQFNPSTNVPSSVAGGETSTQPLYFQSRSSLAAMMLENSLPSSATSNLTQPSYRMQQQQHHHQQPQQGILDASRVGGVGVPRNPGGFPAGFDSVSTDINFTAHAVPASNGAFGLNMPPDAAGPYSCCGTELSMFTDLLRHYEEVHHANILSASGGHGAEGNDNLGNTDSEDSKKQESGASVDSSLPPFHLQGRASLARRTPPGGSILPGPPIAVQPAAAPSINGLRTGSRGVESDDSSSDDGSDDFDNDDDDDDDDLDDDDDVDIRGHGEGDADTSGGNVTLSNQKQRRRRRRRRRLLRQRKQGQMMMMGGPGAASAKLAGAPSGFAGISMGGQGNVMFGGTDSDVDLSAILAAQPTPPSAGMSKAMLGGKRNLSTAAFSLGSYTGAELKRFRDDFNLSGLDLADIWDAAASFAAANGSVVSGGAEGMNVETGTAAAGGGGNADMSRPFAVPRAVRMGGGGGMDVDVEMGSKDTIGKREEGDGCEPMSTGGSVSNSLSGSSFLLESYPALMDLLRPVNLFDMTPDQEMAQVMHAHQLVQLAHHAQAVGKLQSGFGSLDLGGGFRQPRGNPSQDGVATDNALLAQMNAIMADLNVPSQHQPAGTQFVQPVTVNAQTLVTSRGVNPSSTATPSPLSANAQMTGLSPTGGVGTSLLADGIKAAAAAGRAMSTTSNLTPSPSISTGKVKPPSTSQDVDTSKSAPSDEALAQAAARQMLSNLDDLPEDFDPDDPAALSEAMKEVQKAARQAVARQRAALALAEQHVHLLLEKEEAEAADKLRRQLDERKKGASGEEGGEGEGEAVVGPGSGPIVGGSANVSPNTPTEGSSSPASASGVVVGNGARPYRCPVLGCGKTYKNRNGLKYHREHGGHSNEEWVAAGGEMLLAHGHGAASASPSLVPAEDGKISRGTGAGSTAQVAGLGVMNSWGGGMPTGSIVIEETEGVQGPNFAGMGNVQGLTPSPMMVSEDSIAGEGSTASSSGMTSKPFLCRATGCYRPHKNLSGLKHHIVHSHPDIDPRLLLNEFKIGDAGMSVAMNAPAGVNMFGSQQALLQRLMQHPSQMQQGNSEGNANAAAAAAAATNMALLQMQQRQLQQQRILQIQQAMVQQQLAASLAAGNGGMGMQQQQQQQQVANILAQAQMDPSQWVAGGPSIGLGLDTMGNSSNRLSGIGGGNGMVASPMLGGGVHSDSSASSSPFMGLMNSDMDFSAAAAEGGPGGMATYLSGLGIGGVGLGTDGSNFAQQQHQNDNNSLYNGGVAAGYLNVEVGKGMDGGGGNVQMPAGMYGYGGLARVEC
ncbi:hypothetical protein BC829DRAFT_451308 [Chytridium lagenaria]|nr:hypothetical protein BC829DRAFT_451308 [Chytridium lagenaria]